MDYLSWENATIDDFAMMEDHTHPKQMWSVIVLLDIPKPQET